MENEKSVYELRLEDKDKIIDRQFKIIKGLILLIVSMFILLTIGLTLGWKWYLDTPLIETTTSINGTSNSVMNNNELDSSNINENN